MSQNAKQRSRQVLVSHPNTTTFHQHLELSWFVDGLLVVLVLCDVFIVLLVLVLCLVPNAALSLD
jgi:hypothetical protein